MMKDFHIIVQKYGGSSVADPHKIKEVARFIKSCLQNDNRICVVVSAMGHTTNELISLAHQVCQDPPKRELDMLMSCGERTSMALLAMALSDIDVKAISLTGSQSGIITDDNHSAAEIIAVKPSRVQAAFFTHQVVIVAGFQGISEKKEITTLRRGGSDTTAVAMAAALQAEVCEIYTDVDGVMDIDPKIMANAQVLPALTFEHMESMSLYGARVLAHDAIRLAKEHNVALRVGKTFDALQGTRISNKDAPMINNKNILSLTHLRAVLSFSLKGDELRSLVNPAGYFLCGSLRDGVFVGYTSNDIAQELTHLPDTHVRARLALITIHLLKNQVALALLTQVCEGLKQHSMVVHDIFLGHNEIFLIVEDDHLHQALAILHAGFFSGVSL